MDWRKINFNQGTLTKILILTIVLTGLPFALGEHFKTINVSSLPNWIQPYWDYIIVFLTTSAGAFFVGFSYNVYGYLRKYFATDLNEKYDINKLCKTFALYGGIITTFAVAVPSPYKEIATTIVIIIKFVSSELKYLAEAKVV